MNARKLSTTLFLAVACSLLIVSAQTGGGNGWLPGWAEDLGIELTETPAPDEEFVALKGKVVDAEKAAAFFGETEAGTAVELRFAGNVAWTVETDSGTVRPCAVRGSLEGSSKLVTLVPDSKTHKLKPGPPPFKGSSKVAGGN